MTEEMIKVISEKQSKQISEFIVKYNSDEEYKIEVQQTYDNNPYKLPILYVYALEELLRYGTKGIFKKFLEIKGEYPTSQAANLYDEFIKLLDENKSFEQYKIEQLAETPETLSEIEKFAFCIISKSSDKKEQMHEEMADNLEYDPFTPILYSTDNLIRKTLENLLLGEFIHKMLEMPEMKPIKARQKENGRIANIDKEYIIEKIKTDLLSDVFMSQFKKIIDSRYVKVKMALLLGKGANAFDEYLKYNTNISTNEIFGIERDLFSEEFYTLFMEMVNAKWGGDGKPKK